MRDDENRIDYENIGKISFEKNRMLVFPNHIEHKLEPIRLLNPESPGYRSILTVFLVNPFEPILSTSTIQPQQYSQVLGIVCLYLKRNFQIPFEVCQMIAEYASWTCEWAQEVRDKVHRCRRKRFKIQASRGYGYSNLFGNHLPHRCNMD